MLSRLVFNIVMFLITALLLTVIGVIFPPQWRDALEELNTATAVALKTYQPATIADRWIHGPHVLAAECQTAGRTIVDVCNAKRHARFSDSERWAAWRAELKEARNNSVVQEWRELTETTIKFLRQEHWAN